MEGRCHSFVLDRQPRIFTRLRFLTSSEAKAFEAALAVFQSLHGIDDDVPHPGGKFRHDAAKWMQHQCFTVLSPCCSAPRPEHVIIQDFFDDNGVSFKDSPPNWAILAALRRPLSRTLLGLHSSWKHCTPSHVCS